MFGVNVYFTFCKYMPYSGLFHNFILATRIMRSYGCNPVCYPELPHTTHNHPLWRSWDAIVDETLIKLEKRSDFILKQLFQLKLNLFRVGS